MPNNEIKTREDLIYALAEAAEIEHGLCCQYLFAAFSLKRHPDEGNVTWAQLEQMRQWETTILMVTRQEMEHLGYVCNLLTAIGGAPHLQRPNFPQPSRYYPMHLPLTLQRFGEESIRRFICFEQPDHVPEPLCKGSDDAELPRETIGDLYRRIERGFEYLTQHLTQQGESLFIGPANAQIQSVDFPGFYKHPTNHQITILKVVDLASAKQAIEQIIREGEGTRQYHDRCHYAYFKTIYQSLIAFKQADPSFEPARPVVPNPIVRRPVDVGRSTGTQITHPVTQTALNLFNAAYETMLLILIRIFAHADETQAEVINLEQVAFFPMMTMVMRPLGEVLTQMPAFTEGTGTAGPSFEVLRDLQLLPHKAAAWTYLHERLTHLGTDCQTLNQQVATLPPPLQEKIAPRLTNLQKNLTHLAADFARSLETQEG